jgi:hypothetical protein
LNPDIAYVSETVPAPGIDRAQGETVQV